MSKFDVVLISLFKPKEFMQLNKYRRNTLVMCIMAFLVGINATLLYSMDRDDPFGIKLYILIMNAPIRGAIIIGIVSGIIWFSDRIKKGQVQYYDIVSTVEWALMPVHLMTPINFILIATMTAPGFSSSTTSGFIILISIVCTLAAIVWSFMNGLKMIKCLNVQGLLNSVFIGIGIYCGIFAILLILLMLSSGAPA